MSETSEISVVICTRNRPEDVALCLPTVLACLRGNWEVVLVDQSDNADTRAVAARLMLSCPALRYLPEIGRASCRERVCVPV